MTVTGTMIITRGGGNLPLDQRRRDALMTYAQQAADLAGVPRQTWVRQAWKLKDYEAKDLLKGNASETVWERILKGRGPHSGWAVALPVLGAVIGVEISEFFRDQMRQAAKDAARAEEQERLASTAWKRLGDRSDLPRAGRETAEADRQTGRGPGALGAEAAGSVPADLATSRRMARP
jgi:hypothetical protein